MKKKKSYTKAVKELQEGDRFELVASNGLKGVILGTGNMETRVYWYEIPDRWRKEHYDEETLEDEDGNFYEALDVFFFRKKMAISSSAIVKQITD